MVTLFTAVVITILVFFVWLIVDFNIGRKHHLKNIRKRLYPSRNSDVKFYNDGHTLYSDFFNDMKKAKDHIHVLFYIVKHDHISQEFIEVLLDKAKQGVTVRLLLDRIGSNKLPKSQIRKLKDAGVAFANSNQPHFPFFFYTLNYRNHRKIAVIDGNIGYIGGFNIGKEYLGYDPKLGSWRDYHLKVIGEGVSDLQTEFLFDWNRAIDKTRIKEILEMNPPDHSKPHAAIQKSALLKYMDHEHTDESLDDKQRRYFPPLPKGPISLQFFPTDGAYMKEFVIDLFKNAKAEIKIGTPYFIPGKELTKSLIHAASRGVTVKILVPMKSDHMLVKEASFPYFQPLIEVGCQIYQYNEGFYHGKLIIIDGQMCDIGTANFDKRSFFINDEINCLIDNKKLIAKLNNQFESDIAMAKRLTLNDIHKRSYFHKSKESVSKLVSRLL